MRVSLILRPYKREAPFRILEAEALQRADYLRPIENILTVLGPRTQLRITSSRIKPGLDVLPVYHLNYVATFLL